MIVNWTDRAKARLRKIEDYITQDKSYKIARQVVYGLLAESMRLSDLPKSGRKVPEYQLEEVREILKRPYRIVYVIREDRVDVVTVMHYRELLPSDLNDLMYPKR